MTPKYSVLLRDREMENIHRLQLADPPVSCISWRAFALWAGLSPIVSCPFVVPMPTTGLASSCHAFWQVWVQCIVWHQIYWIKVLTNWPPQLHILSQNFALFNFHCILCIEYFSVCIYITKAVSSIVYLTLCTLPKLQCWLERHLYCILLPRNGILMCTEYRIV